MSLLCCFLCLQINIEVNALANIYYSYPGSNLFFINPGFANPSMSRGLLGFPLNPAGLGSLGVKSKHFTLAYLFSVIYPFFKRHW